MEGIELDRGRLRAIPDSLSVVKAEEAVLRLCKRTSNCVADLIKLWLSQQGLHYTHTLGPAWEDDVG